MKKIKTIFERDWSERDHKVVDKFVDGFSPELLIGAKATEKLDGMNIRATLRSGVCVRLEKRRNPDKIQKAKGIEEPWYIDTNEFGPEDKWLFDALKNTDLSNLPDGEWSGEALGKNIQGNTLNLENNRIVFFSLEQAPVFEDAPTTFNELKEWLPKQKSKYGNDCGIEGIVWHCSNGDMYKIKCKDFV
jgi:hypothetical protein